MTRGMREDLIMWKRFLDEFNGVSFWRSDISLKAEFQVHSDAAGSLGFSTYFGGRWCAGTGLKSGEKKVSPEIPFVFFRILPYSWHALAMG